MGQSIHQPAEGPVSRDTIPTDRMREVCGKAVAFVLASEKGTTPLKVEFESPDVEPVICEPDEGETPVARPLQRYDGRPCVSWSIETAREAGVASVVVLTTQELADDISAAIDAETEIIVRDLDAERRATSDAAWFEVHCLPYGLITAMHRRAIEISPCCERILVLSCDQVRLRPEHIYELLADADSHPEADIVTSWIRWFPRTPIAISRAFIESLPESGLLEKMPDSKWRPLPELNAIDHLFGEERLGANAVVSSAMEDYLEDPEGSKVEGDEHDDNSESPGSTDGMHAITSCEHHLENGPAPDELAWADAFGRRCRADFPIFAKRHRGESLVYLDNAATTQRCAQALLAQRDYDENINANVYRGTYELSVASTRAFAEARRKVEKFIGAGDPEEGSAGGKLAFVANTTEAINLVAQAWAMRNLNPGDVIAIALESHHSSIVPFQIAAEMTGAKIRYLPYDASGRIDRDVYSRIMQEHPKLVAIPHVGNVIGIVEPVRELTDEAHAAGARVILDAAQSLPHIPVRVGELDVDWLAFSGHKAYGPMGIGGLWISDEAAPEMDPLTGGGGTISHVGKHSYYLRTMPIQFELGTPPASQAVGLAAALEYLDLLGMDDVRRHEAILTKYLVRRLEDIDGLTLIGDHSRPDGQVGLAAFSIAGVDSMALTGFLGKIGIATRGGGHCALPLQASLGLSGTLRASLGVYNTVADVDALMDGIRTYLDLI